MIDERTRIRESWAMSMDTLIADALKEGREEGLSQGRDEERLNMARVLLRKGMDVVFVQEVTKLDLPTLRALANEQPVN